MDDDWKLPWEGGCRCGRARLRITAAPLISFACHCLGCQRMSGGPVSLTLVVPKPGFTLLQGDTVLGGLQGEHEQHYCEHCKSWLFTRPAGMDMVNVRVSTLDDHQWFAPFAEIWTSERLPWMTTSAPHSYAEAPKPRDYLGLMREFAAHGARPGRPAGGTV